MSADCVDVCGVVVDKLLKEAGFSKGELDMEADDDNAILDALAQVEFVRRLHLIPVPQM